MREPRSAPSTETSPRKMLYTRWKGGRTEGELPTVKLTEATWHKLEHNEQSSNAVTGGAVSHEELISDDFKHHEAIVRRGTM